MKGWLLLEFCMYLLLFFYESFLVDEKKFFLNSEGELGYFDFVLEIFLK